MTRAKIKRMLPYAVILLVSAYFYALSNRFEFVAKPGHIGPDFWPKLCLGLTMAVCLYEIVKRALFSQGQEGPNGAGKEGNGEGPAQGYPLLLGAGIVLTVAYVSLVGVLGFLLCTFLYLALFMIVGRYRKVWAVLVNSVLGTAILAFVFMKVVYVSLPLGTGPFRQASLAVMHMLGIR